MENKGIGVSNLPNLLHNEFRKRPCDLNVMVIGSHGLGKTTFLNKIIGANVLKMQPFEQREDEFWYLEAKCNVQTSSVDVIENEFTTRLNVIEVDCLGDSVDNSGCQNPVVELIKTRFDEYMAKFKEDTSLLIKDGRIHMCFYFLEPIFTIAEPHIETLKSIAPLCTIIPIVAKADLLSSEQVSQIKGVFRGIFQANGISIFDGNEFSEEWPFLIFSETRGEDTAETRGWEGTNIQNQQVNDFLVVKSMLIERDAYQLIKDTDQFYDNYRINKLLQQSTDKDIKEMRERIEKKMEEYQQQVKEMQMRLRRKEI